MSNEVIIGILGTVGVIVAAYFTYKAAWVNKIETPEQKETKKLENENTFAKLHNDLLGQYRARNTELEAEVKAKEQEISNMDAVSQKKQIECASDVLHEKQKRYQMERERNAAFACIEANQRLLRKANIPVVDYEPPNGTTPTEGMKLPK